jgi:mannose-6-phosphate isomerase-like protein (cupin superfamily)
MHAFDVPNLLRRQAASRDLYLEFLRMPSLSMGLYVLEARATDPQQPHAEDEVYVILAGQGMITVGDEERPVESGAVIFVPAHVPHRFHSIVERLEMLVLFAPAESA